MYNRHISSLKCDTTAIAIYVQQKCERLRHRRGKFFRPADPKVRENSYAALLDLSSAVSSPSMYAMRAQGGTF